MVAGVAVLSMLWRVIRHASVVNNLESPCCIKHIPSPGQDTSEQHTLLLRLAEVSVEIRYVASRSQIYVSVP